MSNQPNVCLKCGGRDAACSYRNTVWPHPVLVNGNVEKNTVRFSEWLRDSVEVELVECRDRTDDEHVARLYQQDIHICRLLGELLAAIENGTSDECSPEDFCNQVAAGFPYNPEGAAVPPLGSGR